MTNCLSGPCRECPSRRESVSGWLGAAQTPEEFLFPHYHGGLHLPCHMQVDWSAPDAQEKAMAAPPCYGFLVFLKNSCKMPESPRQKSAIEVCGIEPDRETFLSFPHEFIDHHNKTGL